MLPGIGGHLIDRPYRDAFHVRKSQHRPAGGCRRLARSRQTRYFPVTLVAAVAAFLFYIVGNVQDNLSARYHHRVWFLGNTAGFDLRI